MNAEDPWPAKRNDGQVRHRAKRGRGRRGEGDTEGLVSLSKYDSHLVPNLYVGFYTAERME